MRDVRLAARLAASLRSPCQLHADRICAQGGPAHGRGGHAEPGARQGAPLFSEEPLQKALLLKYCELVILMIMNVILTRKTVRLLLVSQKKVQTLNLVSGFVQHRMCEGVVRRAVPSLSVLQNLVLYFI